MSSEMGLTVRRVLIYLVLAFVPVYLLTIFGSDAHAEFHWQFASVSVMWYPAIANFLTRLITKEGMQDSLLRLHCRGNLKYYLIAFTGPLLLGLLSGVIFFFLFAKKRDLAASIEAQNGIVQILGTMLMLYGTAMAQLFMGFGEEFGWRGYLTPKLEQLMPSPVAVIVSGIIWGLWHAPLILRGYNFGEAHPYWGLVCMCLSCVMLSFILTWMTKKTQSVFPAAIFHMVLDSVMTWASLLPVYHEAEAIMEEHTFLMSCILMCVTPWVLTIPAIVGLYRKPAETA